MRMGNSEQSKDASRLDAVLFDMDGVVVNSATAHAAAWKRLFDAYLEARAEKRGEDFVPFDADADYRTFVDGKPRHDGIADFLAARGIDLPWGSEDDPPDAETVRGLGTRKNGYFQEWLENNRVEAFPGSLAFIDDLRAADIRVGIFSSSRNAEAVLANAGVLDCFDAKVDGVDAADRHLPGKPDPTVLLETAARLGVAPEHCAVVEDALAGVEAGAKGRFGLVIGVARAPRADDLAAAGADLVVGDLAELDLTTDGRIVVKTVNRVPDARDAESEIRTRLAGQRLVVFLDYDGTLTPIVDNPDAADLDPAMRDSVAGLARKLPVAIVSGRGLADLRSRVDLDEVFLAGSHGFEIAGPAGWRETLEKGVDLLPDLDRAERALGDRLDAIDGAVVERKRFSISVHFRRVAAEAVAGVEEAVDEVLAGEPRLGKGTGKKVFQVQPRIDWNKGRAVQWILERLGLEPSGVMPLYIGDDITDEDAFRALSGRGLGIVVRDKEDRPTAADYGLADPAAVGWFLRALTVGRDEAAA